jgi:hypothetical protein
MQPPPRFACTVVSVCATASASGNNTQGFRGFFGQPPRLIGTLQVNNPGHGLGARLPATAHERVYEATSSVSRLVAVALAR